MKVAGCDEGLVESEKGWKSLVRLQKSC